MRQGGCQCGNIRYEIDDGADGSLYICHCRECRKQSASAFGMSLAIPRSAFQLVTGEPAYWTRSADSGNTVACAFCPTCGSRLWHERDAGAEAITVKAGSLDEPMDTTDAIHIWTSRKLPGIVIPDEAARFPEEPD